MPKQSPQARTHKNSLNNPLKNLNPLKDGEKICVDRGFEKKCEILSEIFSFSTIFSQSFFLMQDKI